MRANLKKTLSYFTLALGLLVLLGCQEGGTNIDIDGLRGPTVKLHQDEVQITAVVENVELEGSLEYPIPDFDNSYLKIFRDPETGGASFDIRLSLQDLLGDDVILLPPQFLPGGRNLPGVPSGTLPASAFTVPDFHNITFYVGTDVFGLFLPVPFDIDQTIATFRFYIGGKKMGNISIVGRDINGEHSGVLLLIDMKGSIKRKLKRIRDKYAHLH